jgi:hypothetical protein
MRFGLAWGKVLSHTHIELKVSLICPDFQPVNFKGWLTLKVLQR